MTGLAVIYALSTRNQILLAGMGAIFIAFALLASFYFPSRNPNFPGRRLGWFVVASIALFLAMMAAVLLFGVEEKEPAEAANGGETPTQTAPATTGEAETTTGGAEETTTGGEEEGGEVEGDAAAGKKVFLSAGCTGCHTLKEAGATGTVGPNLDAAKPDESLIEDRVEHGKGPMPSFEGQLTKKQIEDVVAFVYTSTH